LALDEPNKDESSVEVNGVAVLISEDVKGLAEKSRIDYIEGPYREGFTIGAPGRKAC
jgi:Fe-S cluster assembly iron-binding protein IscA